MMKTAAETSTSRFDVYVDSLGLSKTLKRTLKLLGQMAVREGDDDASIAKYSRHLAKDLDMHSRTLRTHLLSLEKAGEIRLQRTEEGHLEPDFDVERDEYGNWTMIVNWCGMSGPTIVTVVNLKPYLRKTRRVSVWDKFLDQETYLRPMRECSGG